MRVPCSRRRTALVRLLQEARRGLNARDAASPTGPEIHGSDARCAARSTSPMTRVRPVSFTDPEARYYIVDGETDGDNALVRRSGELDNVLECLRCGEKGDVRFRCQHIEAVKKERLMDY